MINLIFEEEITLNKSSSFNIDNNNINRNYLLLINKFIEEEKKRNRENNYINQLIINTNIEEIQ